MNTKKLIATAAICGLGTSVFAAPSNDELLNRIKLLESQLEQLKSMVATQVKETVAEEVKKASPVALGSNIDGLKIKGDVRLRYEQRRQDNEGGAEDREKSRFRTRFRLGGVWTNSAENWEIGAGLATGEDSAKSTNDSWGEGSVFETGDIRLDYAYAKHNFQNGVALTLGQQKNPFTTTFMMWDGDIRPAGATLQYKSGNAFVTAGAYNLRGDATADANSKDQSLANMAAGQVGYTFSGEKASAMLALGFAGYNGETTEFQLNGAADDDYKWSIGDIYGEVSTKVGEVKVKAYGQVAKNFGAEDTAASQGVTFGKAGAGYKAEDEDTAWILGLQAKRGPWAANYAYASIGGDSVPYFLSDSDFGAAIPGSDNSVNVKGHKLGLSYSLTKHCSIGATAIFTDYVEPAAGDDDSGELYQFDLGYKF